MKQQLILSLIVVSLLWSNISQSQCASREDWIRTGKFKVLSVKRNLWMTHPWWLFRPSRAFSSCLIKLENVKIYDAQVMFSNVQDVYATGRACGVNPDETIDTTVSHTCCDTLGDFGGYESNACDLSSRHMKEFRERTPDNKEFNQFEWTTDFKSGSKVSISTYESDWATFAEAHDKSDPLICNRIVNQNISSACWHRLLQTKE